MESNSFPKFYSSAYVIFWLYFQQEYRILTTFSSWLNPENCEYSLQNLHLKTHTNIFCACYWELSSLIGVFYIRKDAAAFISYFPHTVNVTFVEAASDKRQHLFCSILQVDPAWGWVCAGPGSPLFRPFLFIPMSAPFATYHPPNSWHFFSIIHPKLNFQQDFSLFFFLLFPTWRIMALIWFNFDSLGQRTGTYAHTYTLPRSGI